MKLFGREITLNEKILISFSEEHVKLGYDDYREALLATQFPPIEASILRKLDFTGSEALLDQWIVTGKGKYVGGWTKRLQKYVEKEYKVKLSPSNLAELGEKLARISVALKGNDFHMELTDHANWTPGTFGESTDSCWWKSFKHAKNGLIADNGGAILLYDEKVKPRSRCWYYPIDFGENIVIFNAYDTKSKLTLLSYARLLSMVYGVTYKRTSDVVIPEAYINGDDKFVVGIKPPTRKLSLLFALKERPIEVIGFSLLGSMTANYIVNDADGYGNYCAGCNTTIATHHAPKGIRHRGGLVWFHQNHLPENCSNCGEHINRNSSLNHWVNGRVYCGTCIVGACIRCRNLIHNVDDDFHTLGNGNLVCGECHEEYYSECTECHQEREDVEHRDLFGRDMCDGCYYEMIVICQSCEDHVLIVDSEPTEEGRVCRACRNEYYYGCERCGNIHNLEYSETVDNTLWCSSCAERHSHICDHCEERVSDGGDHSHEEEE